MTFFPVSLKALAILAVAALAGVAVALTRPKPIDSAVLGSAWAEAHDLGRSEAIRRLVELRLKSRAK